MMTIGLTHTGSEEKHGNYIRWLRGDDDVRIIVFRAQEGNLGEITQCDALVLSGGIDVDPELYHGSYEYKHMPEEGWNRKRDDFETALFHQALERGLPVLAVCRGLQLVNVIQGGTLVQDMGADNNKVHKGEPDKHHPVSILPGTLLHELSGEDFGEINSAHHQCIDALGRDLQVNASAAGGTIEGIEWADRQGKPFFLGVQWHPERMFRFALEKTPLSWNIRERFIQEIQKANTKGS
ncbi:MAG: gamma-glutamyl-gamma-aminobutyrate hydrolase family protein [Bacteroidetes bacterium]|nr:gamma-glutamyl-gamma-aminobutyrate hydrolase family protein [Bacteroidota bacterium]